MEVVHYAEKVGDTQHIRFEILNEMRQQYTEHGNCPNIYLKCMYNLMQYHTLQNVHMKKNWKFNLIYLLFSILFGRIITISIFHFKSGQENP